MKRWLLMGWLMSLLAMVGACDWVAQQELKPGQSTLEDVRKLMGKPEMVWEEGDGRQVLEYPRSPEGAETWMVEIDANGRYQGMKNTLVDANLRQVRPGMSRDDLRRLLGKPGSVETLPLKNELVWTWRVQAAPGRTEMFNVHFGDDGRVASTSRTPDPRTINTQ